MQVGSEIGTNVDIAPEDLFEQVQRFYDSAVEIDVARFENLPPRESQQLPRQRSCAFTLLVDFFKVAVKTRIGFRFFKAHICPAQDSADHIVKIMSDSAGKLADSLEFLSL